jgi:predicted nucleic acid-binding protein
VTVYLLDENVLRELHSKGNAEVRAWYASIAEDDLRISVMTFFEKRRGWETPAENVSRSRCCKIG